MIDTAMKSLLAQVITIQQGDGISPIVINGPLENINTLSDLINRILSLLFPLAGLLLFFFLVRGGFNFITSQGDPEKVKSGKAKMTSAIIGFILLVVSYLFASLIARILGLGEGFF